MRRAVHPVVVTLFTVSTLSCGADEGPGIRLPPSGGASSGAGGSESGATSAGAHAGGGSSIPPAMGGNSATSGGPSITLGGAPSASGGAGAAAAAGGSCASETADATVQPVFLAFAFDVSGSMGAGDFEYHDRTLKWDPVVLAMKSFFEDPGSHGFTASMTLFPAAADKCEDETYRSPTVPLTALPSTEFGRILDERGSQPWRGGTPTLHVVRGVLDFIRGEQAQKPGRYALVLVTDGYPQSCDDNDITKVVTEVANARATVPTYVIGVKNPPLPGAPDTVTNLSDIALAGGTERAYIIDTGNPAQTTATFKATIDAIRGSAIACSIDIPAPPSGKQFDKQKVAVTYRSGATNTRLDYDAACSGQNAWHYDDPANPRQILLCSSACDAVKLDPVASIGVEFTCEAQVDVPR